MPDPTNTAYDPAAEKQALIEQLLADPAFLDAVRGVVDEQAAAGGTGAASYIGETGATDEAISGISDHSPFLLRPFATNPGAATTCSVPLIMPPDDSLHATFSGSTTPLPYRTNDTTASGPSGNIYMFPGTVNGVEVYGFCVDHALPAPTGTFGNISIDVALNGQTEQTKKAVAFVIANVPRLPTDDAADFFDMLGLPCAAGFDGYDARAVGRYVIYDLLGQLTSTNGISGLEFIDRPGYPPIDPAKAACLKQACQRLLEMAQDFGAGRLDCGPGGGPGGGGGSAGAGAAACCNCVSGSNYTCGGCGCAPDQCTCNDPCGLRLGCQIGKIYCCNTNQPVTDGSDTYLVFVGCANDLRECCGRVVVGPFKLASSNRGTPDISLVPCNGCPGADIQLTDFCCNILSQPPAIGDEFYIAFRPPSCRYCFDLCATMETTSVAVYFFRESGNAAVQRQGLSFPRTDIRTACIHICIDITPEPPPPGPEPWWEHILVNNNNNNNNNDSSNNDNNANNSNLISSLVETLLTNLLSGSMMSGMTNSSLLGGGLGPGPPFPPGPFPPGPFPPGPFPPGPFPPGPGPGPQPGPNDGFPFPWHMFPPGATPCPPVGCGGPNPCCCFCKKSPCCCPPPCPGNCCCPCPPPCPPPSWCPPPFPPCPPACPPWPCPEPCFVPFPYIPEPSFIIQPASLTYQAVPMPVPCFCPPAWPQPMPCPPMPAPGFPQPFTQPFSPMPQPFMQPFEQQQVYNTVVVPPADPPQPPLVVISQTDPWTPYGAPPFSPPVMEPMPLLLPEFSSAPRPDLTPFAFEDDGATGLYDQFYRDWYGQ